MKLTLLAVAGAISAPTNTLATPLVTRSIRSDVGWYSWGCYEDCGGSGGMNRFLPYQAYANATNSDPDMCIAACQKAGYGFAGLQWGEECWCGNGLNGATQAPGNQCNMPCGGNQKYKKCGGGCRNSVWTASVKPSH